VRSVQQLLRASLVAGMLMPPPLPPCNAQPSLTLCGLIFNCVRQVRDK
jgi:hypothetical protein